MINSRIDGHGIIEGRFTPDEAAELARLLDAGALPARVNPYPLSVNLVLAK